MEFSQSSLHSLDWDITPTSVELKEIKQMLLSGDIEQILKSVEKIKFFLSNENSLVELIRSDISEFLCDAVAPFDAVTVESLYNCLECMIKHAEFFSHGHACFTIESLIRSIYFLLKNSHSVINLSQCLNLLVLTIQGYNTYRIIPEKKTIGNVLQLLELLLKTSTVSVNNKYQTGNLILAIIDLNTSYEEFNKAVVTSCCSWFGLVSDILVPGHPLQEKFIALCCIISHSLLRCLVCKKDSMEEYSQSKEKNELIRSISNFLINTGAPYFCVREFGLDYLEDFFCVILERIFPNPTRCGVVYTFPKLLNLPELGNLPLSHAKSDIFNLEHFFQSLLYFYSGEITFEKRTIAHALSEMGFLQFATKVFSFADFTHGQKLRKICMLVLSNMILTLSEDIFQFPANDFQGRVQEGMSQLPLDASQWLDILASPYSSPSVHLALILYLYFYSMTAKSQVILESIYPSITNFISFSNGIESSAFVVKLVWFIYVMSQLSKSQHSSLNNSESEATDKVVCWLEAQNDLSLVYTHHPALLYWTFSSKVSSNIQSEIVHLWLRNRSSDCKELEELIVKSSDVRFAVLDILEHGCGQVLESAFLSLKFVLVETGNEDLAANIWFLLPQILAKYSADSTSATNVDYVIELSNLKTPMSLDVTKIIRIAFLLPDILTKSDLISVVPSLTLIFQILQLGFQLKDSRVTSVFLRSEGFVQKVLGGINANISEISVYSLKIFSLLWRNCKEVELHENCKRIKINKEIWSKALENSCVDVLSAALDFIKEVQITNFRSSVFVIEEIDSDFLEILFLEIQNICIKNIPEITRKCWQCLKLFLLVEDPVQNELTSDPLLHELIKLHLPTLKECKDMREFLTVWMNQNNRKLNGGCFGRKIFGGYYSETVHSIASSLMTEELLQEDRKLYEEIPTSVFQIATESASSWKSGKTFDSRGRGHRGPGDRRVRCNFECKRISPALLWQCSPDFVRRPIQIP